MRRRRRHVAVLPPAATRPLLLLLTPMVAGEERGTAKKDTPREGGREGGRARERGWRGTAPSMSILLACATSNIESPTGAFTVCLLPSGFTKVTLMVFFAAAGEGGGKTGVRAAYVGGVRQRAPVWITHQH